MLKNVATKLICFAWDVTTGLPKVGDAANLTAYVSEDFGSVTVLADTSAAELDSTNAKGYYTFDLAQGETNADVLLFTVKSSTSDVTVVAVPAVVFTRPTAGLASPTNITAAAGCAVSSIGNNVITAASINADAFTSAKFADDCFTVDNFGDDCFVAGNFADGFIVAASFAAGAIDAAAIADNAIDAGAIAANAITAAKIADGAIDAATFAADVDAEILSYIVDDATRIDASALNTASGAIGSNGSGLTEAGGTGDQFTGIPWNAAWDAEVQSEVQDALVANNLDHLLVSSVATDWDTTVHPDSVIGYLATDGVGTGTTSGYNRLHHSLEALADTLPSLTADAVWDEDASGHQTTGTFGQAIGDPGADTNTIFAAVVTNATGNTVGDDTASLLSRMGTPSNLGGGATLAANLSDIESQTDDIGAAGAGLTAIPWNASWDAEVQSEVQDALVANNLDHLVVSAVDTNWDTTVHPDSVVGYLATNGVGTGTTSGYNRLHHSLESLADTLPSLTADAVWEEQIGDHSGTSGSTAESLNAAGGSGDPWNTSLPGAYASGKAGFILGTFLDVAVTSRMATYTQPTGFLAATFPATVASPTNITAGTITTVTNLTNAPTNGDLTATMKASVNTEVDTALSDIGLDHLLAASVAGSDVTDNSIIAKLVSKSSTADWDSYVNTTDALEALRDRGDAAWTTATGFSTHSASDVWAVATRVLTAGTNIVLAKGTGVTGFTDIDAAGVRTAVGLASANLDTQLGDLPTNAELATALAAADDAVLAAIAALNNLSAAQVNAQVLDVLTVDTFAQPGQESPAATQTLGNMLAYLYKAFRNKTTQTSTTYSLFADNTTTVDQKSTVSDDGTTFTRGEVVTGP